VRAHLLVSPLPLQRPRSRGRPKCCEEPYTSTDVVHAVCNNLQQVLTSRLLTWTYASRDGLDLLNLLVILVLVARTCPPSAGLADDGLTTSSTATQARSRQTRLRTAGRRFEAIGDRLRRIRAEGWTGPAASNFDTEMKAHPKHWYTAADRLSDVACQLEDYAETLRWDRPRRPRPGRYAAVPTR